MRHRKLAGRLGRTSAHRRAMFRNLVTSLLDHERVTTTDAKARQVRRLAERMITLGKRGTLHARRRALRVVRSRQVTAKLFTDLAERYRERPGGYTRVVKVGRRAGDAAPVSVVELVEAGSRPSAPKAPKGRRRRSPAPGKSEQAEGAQPAAGRARRGRRAKTAASGEAEAEAAAPKRRLRLGARAKKSAEAEEKPTASKRSGGAKKRTAKASGRKKRS